MSTRRILKVAAVTALLLAGVSTRSVSADPSGTPNINACVGQAMAMLAQQGLLNVLPLEEVSFTRSVQRLCAEGYSPAVVVQKVREAAGSQ